jgi:hypothetical protein
MWCCGRITEPARRGSSITPGDTIDILYPASGETQASYLFVAVLGASNTYAETTWTRDLTD